MASLAISGWGLPMKVGSRPVAVVSIRHTLPQSGTEPVSYTHLDVYKRQKVRS